MLFVFYSYILSLVQELLYRNVLKDILKEEEDQPKHEGGLWRRSWVASGRVGITITHPHSSEKQDKI